ncbi:MAG TPA: TRAP transporter small permease subunit [Myxococcota bacterium]|nr:TRAP transporter small permease subunit [Myxococcota bacterium]
MAAEPARSEGGSRLERALESWAGWISWIWLLLIGVIVLSVLLRFGLGLGRIELEELQWHLYAVGLLTGIVACANRDRHVRVDVFRERMTPRTRAWVDLYGLLLLQIPFVLLVLWSSVPFVADSFETGERSASAGGLPFRWVLKACLPLAFALLGMATLARLLRVGRMLFGSPDPGARRDASR